MTVERPMACGASTWRPCDLHGSTQPELDLGISAIGSAEAARPTQGEASGGGTVGAPPADTLVPPFGRSEAHRIDVPDWREVRRPGDRLVTRGEYASELGTGLNAVTVMHRLRAVKVARSDGGRVKYVLPHGASKESVVDAWLDENPFVDDQVIYEHSELVSILEVQPSRRAIQQAYAFLVAEGANVNAYELAGTIGGYKDLCRDFLLEVAMGAGKFIPLRATSGGPLIAPMETVDDVLERLALTHPADGTGADPKARKDAQPLSGYDCRALKSLENESLFRITALYLLIRQTEDVHPDAVRRTLIQASRLDVVLKGVSLLRADEMTTRLTEYLEKGILPLDSDGVRATAIYQLYAFYETIGDWIDLLRPGAAKKYFEANFMVALPRRSSKFISILKRLDKDRDAAALRSRRVRRDRLVHGYDLMRFMVDVRFLQVSRMHQAYSEVVAELAAMPRSKREKQLPYEFTYRETLPALDGSPPVEQDVLLRVTTRARVLDDLAHRSTAEYLVRQRAKGGKDYDPADEDDFLLEYVSTEPAVPGGPVRPLWLVDVVRSCFFHNPMNLRAPEMKSRRDMMKELRIGPSAAQRALPFLGFGSHYLSADIYRAMVHLGRTYLPIDNLFMAASFGRVAIRITTTNGARPSEVMQMQADPERWGQILDLQNRVDVSYFEAVAKARQEFSVFFIDERTREAVDELITFLRWRYYQNDEIPLMPCAHSLKCKRLAGEPLPDARYIMSWKGQALDHSEFTLCQRLMCQGLGDYEYYDLRHAFAAVARAENMPRDVLMKVMHHSRAEETDHYSDPTAQEKAAFFTTYSSRRMHLSSVFEAAEEILDDAEADALDRIGVLSPTPGGHCLNGEPCGDATACVGCAMNRADPSRRAEVVEMEQLAQAQLERAERLGQTRFVEQARRMVDDARAMLREMDLIESVGAHLDQPLVVRRGHGTAA
jgi:hypothetical protein